MSSAIVSFTVVAVLLTITPGLDTMLVISQSLRTGHRAALACGLGINTGLVLWATASVLGLSTLLTASHITYEAVRLLGAAYLAFIGIRTLIPALRSAAPKSTGTRYSPAASPGRAFRRGLTTNLLNPKVGVFYVSLLPQFAPPGRGGAALLTGLAGIHLALSLTWLAALAHLASRAAAALSARMTTWLERITGVAMIGFGVRIALQPSP